MILLSDRKNSRYYLAPDAQVLGVGDLVLQSLSGEAVKVDPKLAAQYQVPEAVAKAFAKDQTQALKEFLAQASGRLDRVADQGTRQIEEMAAKAGIDPSSVLEHLGIDANSSAEDQLGALLEMVKRLGVEIPEGIGAVQQAQRDLANIDEALAGPGAKSSGKTTALLKSLADDPDADDSLRAELAELEKLSRELDQGSGSQ